ncbi:sporulation phosphorelay system protein KapB [Paenibacillus senegalensis]|uniref:sporulation phosphorelay system protein KapB n=1 Tax=Paenibacillus senegalensis TaxID=1465766 RepID=UPI0002896D99|nr:sporulation phosphorelay system protein KapB [Paenibacillus senegalensis]
MVTDSFEIGQTVIAEYKTGVYLGTIVDWNPDRSKAAVQIQAVVKHPEQGNLHSPHNPDVAFFHQRRALAFQEIALMPVGTCKPYSGSIPDYHTSLKEAVKQEMEQLEKTIRFSERCLQELRALSQDYGVESEEPFK